MKNKVYKLFLGALSYTAQIISNLLNSNRLHVCRFQPTCSVYAHQALHQFNLGSAFFLIARRVLRCHPFGAFGVDPIPQRHSHG